MPTTFRANDAGMRTITATMGAQAALQAAQRGVQYARSIAPVRTGEYRRSLQAIPTKVNVGNQIREGAAIVTTSPHGVYVEWGHSAKHVLARTADVVERGF